MLLEPSERPKFHPRDSRPEFQSAGVQARRKKRPIDADAPVSDAHRRITEPSDDATPWLPTELWTIIAAYICDWQTLTAFSVTCWRFYRIVMRKEPQKYLQTTIMTEWRCRQRNRIAMSWLYYDDAIAGLMRRALETARYQINYSGWWPLLVQNDEDREEAYHKLYATPGQFALACNWISMMWMPSPVARKYNLCVIADECSETYNRFDEKLGACDISRGVFLLALVHGGHVDVPDLRSFRHFDKRHVVYARMQPRVAAITGDSISFATPARLLASD